jgi:AcrR family transcriptional regulator
LAHRRRKPQSRYANSMRVVTIRRIGHSTRQALISTVVRLLETHNPEDLRVDQILGESGVSAGSMYHHFKSLGDLVDQTLITQCAEITDKNIDALARLTSAATDKETLSSLLRAYLHNVVGPNQRAERSIRTRALARATNHEGFRVLLARENARVTGAVAEFVQTLQSRGLVNKTLGPLTVAVFAMAYTIGLAVNDFAEEPVEVTEMVSLIASFYDNVVIAD